MRKIRNVFLAGLAICAAAAFGLTAGAAAAQLPPLLAPAGVSAVGQESVAAPEPTYPENAKGQTFGSVADSVSPLTEPDLILVLATNGEEGYVKKADLDAATGASVVTTPKEALAWQEGAGKEDKSITVYLSDGKTEVGTFVVVGTDEQAETAE